MKTIAQMAGEYGVSLRTLRFYEERGLIKPRREATARFYGEKDELRLQLILRAKRLGFSLREIDRIVMAREAETTAKSDNGNVTLLLTPSLVREQIERLEKRRIEVAQAIEELGLHLKKTA